MSDPLPAGAPADTHAGTYAGALAATLQAELAWLDAAIQHRFARHVEQAVTDPPAPSPPRLEPGAGDPFADACRMDGLGAEERLVLILALAPWLRPQVLDPFLLHNRSIDRRFTEVGGLVGFGPAFLPTHQTALFLLAGDDLAARLAAMRLLARDGALARARLLAVPRNPAPWTPLRPRRRFLEMLFGPDRDG